MKIVYTNQAINDLKRLRAFIAQENPKAASEVAEKLKQAITRLFEFPMLGKEVKSTESSVSLRDLITGKYLIRYVLLKHEIIILRVWHGKEEKP